MKRKLQLNIPTPCHENWDNMLPADKGKFCQSCNKDVIDFSLMSDLQLIAFFKQPTTGSVCGRFMNDQLNRSISEPKKQLPWIKYFFQIALPALLISTKVYAQGQVKGKVATVCSRPVKGDAKPLPTFANGVRTITGKVVDETGRPLPYSSIIIKGTSNGVAADSAGNFSINTPIDSDSVVLTISSVGFLSREETINLFNDFTSQRVFVLQVKELEGVKVTAQSPMHTLGGAVGGVMIVRSSRFVDLIKDSLPVFSPRFLIYPNPVNVGNTITIQNRKLESDLYTMQVINVSGQIIHTEKRQLANSQSLTLPNLNLTPGAYFVKLVGSKKQKSFSEKFIVR